MLENLNVSYKTKVDSGLAFPADALKIIANVGKQAFDDQILGEFTVKVVSKNGNIRQTITFSDPKFETANTRNASLIGGLIEKAIAGGGDDKIGVKFIVKM